MPERLLKSSRFARRWTTLAAVLLLGSALAAAPTEYQIKGVFLYHFTQFVTWPPEAFADPQAPIVIGILGDDPFGAELDEIVQGEKVEGHPLAVQRFRRVEDIGVCHVLFISPSETVRLEQILAGLKGRNVLTVGDTEGYATRGVMIRFLNEKNRIRLRINVEAAKAAQLTISSKLLRPADIVDGKGG